MSLLRSAPFPLLSAIDGTVQSRIRMAFSCFESPAESPMSQRCSMTPPYFSTDFVSSSQNQEERVVSSVPSSPSTRNQPPTLDGRAQHRWQPQQQKDSDSNSSTHWQSLEKMLGTQSWHCAEPCGQLGNEVGRLLLGYGPVDAQAKAHRHTRQGQL